MTLTVDSDLNGASPQFTLTCISTGGPATTVTWTRNSATAMGDEMTVFNDAETATYTHTLTVTGRLGGDYQCTVSNAKPSVAVVNFTVQGMYVYMCVFVSGWVFIYFFFLFPFSFFFLPFFFFWCAINVNFHVQYMYNTSH